MSNSKSPSLSVEIFPKLMRNLLALSPLRYTHNALNIRILLSMDSKLLEKFYEYSHNIYSAVWGLGLLLTLVLSLTHATILGRIVLLAMFPFTAINILNTLTTRRSRALFLKIKEYTQIANLVVSIGLITLMCLGSYEAFRLEFSVLLSVVCFFEVIRFISTKYDEKQFLHKILNRRSRGRFLAMIALGYAIVLPFNVEHSQFWRLLLAALIFANLHELDKEHNERIVYYTNIAAISLILCAGILMGPAETLFPGFFIWFVVEASLILLERVLFSKKTVANTTSKVK